MLTVREAAQMIHADESTIYQLAESGEIHFTTTNRGMLLICPDSLMISRRDEQYHAKQALLITDGKL
jgi:excisionase family DNA binding protein